MAIRQLYVLNSLRDQGVHFGQVLALNRGESQKVLSVKILIPDWFINGLKYFCRNRFLNGGRHYPLRTQVFEKSFKDAFARLSEYDSDSICSQVYKCLKTEFLLQVFES